jgi:hypothetical protein
LLGAAVATAFAAIALRDRELNAVATIGAATAAVAYVVAVICFLAAGAWPTPEFPDDIKENGVQVQEAQAAQPSTVKSGYLQVLTAYTARETAPIKNLTIAGSVAGGLAVTATCVAAIAALFPPSQVADLYVLDSKQQQLIEDACPRITSPFEARVTFLASTKVRVEVSGDTCGTAESMQFLLPSDEEILLAGPS